MANLAFAWKIALIVGIFLSLVAFILGWIGFGVPDWHKFQRFNGSTVEFYGLWAYCQDQGPTFGTVCKRWPTAADELFGGNRPNFIRTSEGLITTGMILLSLGLIAGALAIALPFLAYLAAALAFMAFIFLVVGLPIFGRQSNSFSELRGDASHNKRYGFWLFVPTIVLEFLAILAFLAAGILYKLFGYGNIGTSFANKPYGGQKMLGPANMLDISYGMRPPMYNVPYGMRPSMFNAGGMISSPYSSIPLAGESIPSLLSEYLSQRPGSYYGPVLVRSTTVTALPQPSIVRAITPASVPNVTPAYVRVSQPIPSPSSPIINMSGQTILGPLQRLS